MERSTEKPRISATEVWAKFGITEHYGGYFATEELFRRCYIRPEQDVLVVGCGTGYTPMILARDYRAKVMATDIDPRMLELARERIIKEGVQDRVRTQIADVQNLPFDTNSYDAVLAESVLVFTDPKKSATEMYRVLKPGGIVGVNEVTFFKRLPQKTLDVLAQFYPSPIQILSENEWKQIFQDAGFENVTSVVHKLNYWKQFLSHMKIDGPRKFFAGWWLTIADPNLRSAFFKTGLIWATIDLLRYMDYGLYTGRKPDIKL